VATAGGQVQVASQGLISCGASLVPAMTSATLPSGSVTRSGAFGTSYEAWQAFDASDTSMWLSQEGQAPAWLAYEWADGPKRVTHYAVKYSNGSILSRAPKSWTLEGWNGSAWVVVDTRTSEINWGGSERREYAVASPGHFSKYRLHVTDDNDSTVGIVVISMGRLELLGCRSPSDTQAPGAPVLTGFSPASPSNSTQPTLSGTAEAGATVRLFSGTACTGTLLTTVVASSSGAFFVARTVAANTTSTFVAAAVDAAGNVSACSASISYRHDGQPPAAPSLTGFTPSSPGQSLTPQLRGTAEKGATVQLFSGSGCVAPALASLTADASTGAFATTVSVSANASAAFSARAVDAVGNSSTCSTVTTYVHDNTAPAAPVFSEGLIPFDSAPTAGLVRAQTEPRARVSLFSDVACPVPANPATVAQADATGVVNVPLTQAQADVTLFAVATDLAGNRSSCVSFEAGCRMGFEDCDGDPSNGCEADLMRDEAHCGACGTTCGGAPSANGVCGAGTCGLGCVVGTFDCDGDAANGCESATA
jgi:hypothetical protein